MLVLNNRVYAVEHMANNWRLEQQTLSPSDFIPINLSPKFVDASKQRLSRQPDGASCRLKGLHGASQLVIVEHKY